MWLMFWGLGVLFIELVWFMTAAAWLLNDSSIVTAQVFSQSLRQVIDFVHCGVEYHASFTKQSLFSTLEKSLAVTGG
jgi:hypothetical protein